jgi:hypothetical protein
MGDPDGQGCLHQPFDQVPGFREAGEFVTPATSPGTEVRILARILASLDPDTRVGRGYGRVLSDGAAAPFLAPPGRVSGLRRASVLTVEYAPDLRHVGRLAPHEQFRFEFRGLLPQVLKQLRTISHPDLL